MAVDQGGVDRTSAMGATIRDGGTGFRTWAPNASAVFVVAGDRLTGAAKTPGWQPAAQDALAPLGDGSWGGVLSPTSARLETAAPWRPLADRWTVLPPPPR